MTILLYLIFMLTQEPVHMDSALYVAKCYHHGQGVAKSDEAAVDTLIRAFEAQQDVDGAIQKYHTDVVIAVGPKNAYLVFHRLASKSDTAERLAEFLKNNNYAPIDFL